MNSLKLNEFRFLREVAIIYMARETGLSLQKILQLTVEETPQLVSDRATRYMQEYLASRNNLFSKTVFLFPTEDGHLFVHNKFKQNLRKLLKLAGQSTSQLHPAKLLEFQVQAIVNLKFRYQRSKFQQILVAGLLGFLALRPGEVANLKKEDVDLERAVLTLRETKSQETQFAPIHADLLPALRNYLMHLKPGENLFVRNTDKPWTRKEVNLSIRDLGKTFGVSDINPRKMRSSVTHYLIANGVPMNVISEILRHKDKATAPRHYTPLYEMEAVREATKLISFKPNKLTNPE